MPGGRIGPKPGKCQGAGCSRFAGVSRAIGLAGQPGGSRTSGGKDRRKMPGRRLDQTAGLDRPPGKPDCQMGQATKRAGYPEHAERLGGPRGRKLPVSGQFKGPERAWRGSLAAARAGQGGQAAWNRTG